MLGTRCKLAQARNERVSDRYRWKRIERAPRETRVVPRLSNKLKNKPRASYLRIVIHSLSSGSDVRDYLRDTISRRMIFFLEGRRFAIGSRSSLRCPAPSETISRAIRGDSVRTRNGSEQN